MELERGFLPLLDVNQNSKRPQNGNNGVPIPAMQWHIGELDPVVVARGEGVRTKFRRPRRKTKGAMSQFGFKGERAAFDHRGNCQKMIEVMKKECAEGKSLVFKAEMFKECMELFLFFVTCFIQFSVYV